MAHQESIASWLFSKRDLFKLKYVQLDWPLRYLPGLCDYECQIEWDGAFVCGRGVSFNKELAVEKASAEAIERLICKALGMGSAGFAVSGKASSFQHAKNEILERHLLDRHLKQNLSLKTIELRHEHFVRNFADHNSTAQLKFYQMHSDCGGSGIVAHIKSITHDFVGFGYSDDLKNASQSAFFEAITNFAAFSDSPASYNIEVSKNPSYWHLQPQFIKRLLALVDHGSQASQPPPKIYTELINIGSIPVLADCPIVPVRAFIEMRGT